MGLFSFFKRNIPSPEQWGAKSTQRRIAFGLELTFIPDMHDVIYVEDEYDQNVNNYIKNNYDSILQQFKTRGINFIYLPFILGREIPKEVIQYMFPYVPDGNSFKPCDITIDILKQHVVEGVIEGPAFIQLREETYERYITEMVDGKEVTCLVEVKIDDVYPFSYCPLVPDSKVSLAKQVKWYIENVHCYYDGGAHYMPVLPSGDEVADACFIDGDADSSSIYAPFIKDADTKLVSEIIDRIHELRKRGYQLGQLWELVEDHPTLSRLVVTKDFRILLPDYSNMEITISPLPKAVFLLFLKHPEGILFKHLQDYYEELLDIYKQISNRVIESNIESSIRDITDPTNNSINEKCARIREAFLKQFDVAYAKHYYITGKRGEAKKITLPCELVDLQGLQ